MAVKSHITSPEEDWKAFLACIDSWLIQNERLIFLRRDVAQKAVDSPTTTTNAMDKNDSTTKSTPSADLESLPTFWRTLIFPRKHYSDERDYNAAIRAMVKIYEFSAEFIAPYFKAALISKTKPGAMYEFAESLKGDLPAEMGRALVKERLLPPGTDEEFHELMLEMENSAGDEQILRCLLLLTRLDRAGGFSPLMIWLGRPNPFLKGLAPLEVIGEQRWKEVADLAQKVLVGVETQPPGSG